MAVISVFYGTVESGKRELIYNSVSFEYFPIKKDPKDFNLRHIIISPENDPDFENGIIFYKNKKIKTDIVFTFKDFIKLKIGEARKLRVIHIVKSHLFAVEELKHLFFLVRDRLDNPLVGFLSLEKDYIGKTYPQFEYLISIADYKERFKSECSICGREAMFNQGLLDGIPVPFIPKQFEVNITYEPRCERCYVSPKEVSEEIAFDRFEFSFTQS
jgi:thymidine kinase